MRKKRCPKCLKQKTKKFGRRNGKQRYKCNECSHIFLVKIGRKKGTSLKLWKEYAEKNQTYEHLAEKYKISINTIKRRLEKTKTSSKKFSKESGANCSCFGYNLLEKDFGVDGI